MLTVAEETLQESAAERRQKSVTHLYGQEINPETYAICKADMLLKGEGENADHIVGGAEWSTLSHDAFPAQEFDFMLANPPYGKSWKKDLEAMGGKEGMRDPRFKVMHKGEELSLVTRSSDGQLLFLANMASKMNHKSALGSRIAEVHNGSSLFTGDAGQGESNIRRWLFENDWVEAIVALPLNLFYNTGIATYVWVLSNRKAAPRKGRCSSSTPASGSSHYARISARRTASCPRRHPAGDADVRRVQGEPSRRYFRTMRSATGRSPSSARCASTASSPRRPSRRSASPPATKNSRLRFTTSLATTCSRTSQGSRRAREAPRRLGQR